MIRRGHDRQRHRRPGEIPLQLPSVLAVRTGQTAGIGAIDGAVGEGDDLLRLVPVNYAITAVAAADVRPRRRTGRAGGAVVLQAGVDDARIGGMLGDEVATQAGETVVLAGEFAGGVWIAIEEHAAVAATPQL